MVNTMVTISNVELNTTIMQLVFLITLNTVLYASTQNTMVWEAVPREGPNFGFLPTKDGNLSVERTCGGPISSTVRSRHRVNQ